MKRTMEYGDHKWATLNDNTPMTPEVLAETAQLMHVISEATGRPVHYHHDYAGITLWSPKTDEDREEEARQLAEVEEQQERNRVEYEARQAEREQKAADALGISLEEYREAKRKEWTA